MPKSMVRGLAAQARSASRAASSRSLAEAATKPDGWKLADGVGWFGWAAGGDGDDFGAVVSSVGGTCGEGVPPGVGMVFFCGNLMRPSDSWSSMLTAVL